MFYSPTLNKVIYCEVSEKRNLNISKVYTPTVRGYYESEKYYTTAVIYKSDIYSSIYKSDIQT